MRINTKKQSALAYLAKDISFDEMNRRLKVGANVKKLAKLVYDTGGDLSKAVVEYSQATSYSYLTQSFIDSIYATHGKIWDDDFEKTHIFEKCKRVVITKDWVFFYNIYKGGTLKEAEISMFRIANGDYFVDVSAKVSDQQFVVITDSHDANDAYKDAFYFFPFNLEVFLLYAPNDAKVMPKKSKTKLFHCKYFNELPFDIQLLDLNYYTQSRQTNPFSVRGHWRLQACGENRKDRKLKWIDLYWKEGYTKGAYKDKT